MKKNDVAKLSDFALRRLIAYLDERLSTVQHDQRVYQRVKREYDEARVELVGRNL